MGECIWPLRGEGDGTTPHAADEAIEAFGYECWDFAQHKARRILSELKQRRQGDELDEWARQLCQTFVALLEVENEYYLAERQAVKQFYSQVDRDEWVASSTSVWSKMPDTAQLQILEEITGGALRESTLPLVSRAKQALRSVTLREERGENRDASCSTTTSALVHVNNTFRDRVLALVDRAWHILINGRAQWQSLFERLQAGVKSRLGTEDHNIRAFVARLKVISYEADWSEHLAEARSLLQQPDELDTILMLGMQS